MPSEAMQEGAPSECFYPAEDLMRYAEMCPPIYDALKKESGVYMEDPNKGWQGKAYPVSVAQSHDSV